MGLRIIWHYNKTNDQQDMRGHSLGSSSQILGDHHYRPEIVVIPVMKYENVSIRWVIPCSQVLVIACHLGQWATFHCSHLQGSSHIDSTNPEGGPGIFTFTESGGVGLEVKPTIALAGWLIVRSRSKGLYHDNPDFRMIYLSQLCDGKKIHMRNVVDPVSVRRHSQSVSQEFKIPTSFR